MKSSTVKKLTLIFSCCALAAAIVLFTMVMLGCSQQQTTSHEVRYTDNGQDSVVYVHYYDQNQGLWVNYYMEYLIFMNLYDMGGYRSVYGYYNQHAYDINRLVYYRNTYHYFSPNYYMARGYSKNSTGNGWTKLTTTRNTSSPNHSTVSASTPATTTGNVSSPSSQHQTTTKNTNTPSATKTTPSVSRSSPSVSRSSPSHR
jgi:hypothetical protein